jgi:hypothetical protein
MPLLEMLMVVPRPVFKTCFLRTSEYRRFIRIGYRTLARLRGSDSTTTGGTGENICGKMCNFLASRTRPKSGPADRNAVRGPRSALLQSVDR